MRIILFSISFFLQYALFAQHLVPPETLLRGGQNEHILTTLSGQATFAPNAGIQKFGYSNVANGAKISMGNDGGEFELIAGNNIFINRIGNKINFSAASAQKIGLSTLNNGTLLQLSNDGGEMPILNGAFPYIVRDENKLYLPNHLQKFGYSNVTNGAKISLGNDGGEFELLAGSNITINRNNNKISFSAAAAATYTASNGIEKISNDFQLKIDGLSIETSPVLGDYIPLFDVSQNTENRMTITTLKTLVADGNTTYTANNGILLSGSIFQLDLNSLSVETAPVLGDYIPLFDVSQNTENRMSLTTLRNLIDTDTDTQLTTEQVQDVIGGMVSGNTETGISVVYSDTQNKLNFSVSGGNTYTGSNGIVKIDNDFQLDLNSLSVESAPVLGDYIPLFDVSQNTENRMSLTTLRNLIDTDTDTQLTTEQVQDAIGAMFSGNTETGISVVYSDNTNKINFTVSGGGGSNDGNGIFSSGGTAAGTLNMNSNSISNFGSITSTTFGGILTTQYTIVPSLNDLEIRLTGGKKYVFNNTGTPTLDDHIATKKYVDDQSTSGAISITSPTISSNTYTKDTPRYIQTAADNILLDDNRVGSVFTVYVYAGQAQINTTSGKLIIFGSPLNSGTYNQPEGSLHTYVRDQTNTNWIVFLH